MSLSLIKSAVHITELTDVQVKELQDLLNKSGASLDVDGILGPQTRETFAKFKNDNYLTYPEFVGQQTVDYLKKKSQKKNSGFQLLATPKVINGKKMICSLPDNWQQRELSGGDYQNLAKEFKIEEAAARAIIKVESNGSGFLLQDLPPARPKILFEGHHFYRQSKLPISQNRPDLSYKTWTRKYYLGGTSEWDRRFLDAYELDAVPAMLSTSWGLGQVMGFNYKVAGCKSVEEFVVEAHKDEYHQARHMFNFCANSSETLLPAIRNRNWATVARLYNGPAYKKNNYDTKLAQAYQSFK